MGPEESWPRATGRSRRGPAPGAGLARGSLPLFPPSRFPVLDAAPGRSVTPTATTCSRERTPRVCECGLVSKHGSRISDEVDEAPLGYGGLRSRDRCPYRDLGIWGHRGERPCGYADGHRGDGSPRRERPRVPTAPGGRWRGAEHILLSLTWFPTSDFLSEERTDTLPLFLGTHSGVVY